MRQPENLDTKLSAALKTADGFRSRGRDAAAKARGAAMKELRKRHQEEYDALHQEERAKLGLGPVAGGTTTEELRALRFRVKDLERKLEVALQESTDS